MGRPFIFDRAGKRRCSSTSRACPSRSSPGSLRPLGVPSYAGVPLTYPGAGDTLTLVRGHEDERQTAPDVDWSSLAKLEGTVVCYAGARQLAPILDALLSHGRPPAEPVAVIFNGTLPSQHTDRGHARGGRRCVGDAAHGRPSILVVGRAAALRQHLRWFDARPLFGRRILVTTPREDAAN